MDIGRFADRYSVPFDRLQYIFMGDHKVFLDSKNNRAVTKPLNESIIFAGSSNSSSGNINYDEFYPNFPERNLYYSEFVSKDYLIENLATYLKILCSNELLIKEHPGALYKYYE